MTLHNLSISPDTESAGGGLSMEAHGAHLSLPGSGAKSSRLRKAAAAGKDKK